MLEKTIVNNILKYLKGLDNCFCFKEHGGRYGTAGIPDIICCYRGRFIGFEVKTETGKTTVLQEQMLKKITEANGMAMVVRSVDEVKKAITELEVHTL